ncbi:uncharacterized protein [Eurosta solidaginis]|uniref:uncharacterized protein n=1 Tax=Eurosta solidaginis TaxID=178769 RepID=UPI00353130F1
MGSKYFSKASFFGFFKRFTTNELTNRLSSGKLNNNNNKSIQNMDRSRHLPGWKYYYNQWQITMGKFVGGFETKLSKMGRNLPETGGNSFRQAKRQILQLVVDSKERIRQLEREFERLRNMVPYKETANLKLSSSQRPSTFSVSMMEEGKIGAFKAGIRITEYTHPKPPLKELLSQYDLDTTFSHEPHYKGRFTCLKFPQIYNYRKSFMISTAANHKDQTIVDDEAKVDTAKSL